jgi:hypothetical protein
MVLSKIYSRVKGMGLLFTKPLWENGKIFPAFGIMLIVFGAFMVVAAIMSASLINLLIGAIMVSSGFLLYHFGIEYVRNKRKEKEKEYYKWANEYEQYMKHKYVLQEQNRSGYSLKLRND